MNQLKLLQFFQSIFKFLPESLIIKIKNYQKSNKDGLKILEYEEELNEVPLIEKEEMDDDDDIEEEEEEEMDDDNDIKEVEEEEMDDDDI